MALESTRKEKLPSIALSGLVCGSGRGRSEAAAASLASNPTPCAGLGSNLTMALGQPYGDASFIDGLTHEAAHVGELGDAARHARGPDPQDACRRTGAWLRHRPSNRTRLGPRAEGRRKLTLPRAAAVAGQWLD